MRLLSAAGAVFLGALLIMAAWYLPNRRVDPHPAAGAAIAGGKFQSLSFGAYRPWESPVARRFPTMAEADSDMALVAGVARNVRTYSADEGALDVPALAARHGVTVWQGIWLNGNAADTEREIARGIALANKYPDTITRVVVGNEVLLRRDLSPQALISYIDRVKRAVKQPVAYADVWNFWLQFPEVAPHVDVMMIHLLPYWEDVPTGIAGAVAQVGRVYDRLHARFPHSQIAIGETGWPSAGRQRADAVPSRVNELRFLRDFLALAAAKHFDYNFIEAFDQDWKYEDEGIVGARWGIFDDARVLKMPLSGAIRENPLWLRYAVFSLLAGLALAGFGFTRSGLRRPAVVGFGAMLLGGAIGLDAAAILPNLFDAELEFCGVVNFAGSVSLATLAIGALARGDAGPEENAAGTMRRVRALLRGALPPRGAVFADLQVLFLFAAAVEQWLLVCAGRYHEFPLGVFAVPVLVAAGSLIRGAWPRRPGREEALLAASLILGAVASQIIEGKLNGEAWLWNACALVLAAPLAVGLYQILPSTRAGISARPSPG